MEWMCGEMSPREWTHRPLAGGCTAEGAQGGKRRCARLRVAVSSRGDQPPQRVAVQSGGDLVAAAVAGECGGGSAPHAGLPRAQPWQAPERGGCRGGGEAGGEGQEAVAQLGGFRLWERKGQGGEW